MPHENPIPEMEGGSYLGLPGRDHWDPAIYALEQERIFYRSWFCVGREEQIPGAGDFLSQDVAGESILAVRGADGAVRAFYNVCQHRGARLCEGVSGHARRHLVCPYHRWAYELDGRLAATPNVHDEGSVDRGRRGLRPVSVDCWEGFVFVNLASDPLPLPEYLAREPEGPLSFARYRIGELRLAHRIVYEVGANWKVIHDNFNECLHCPGVHPEMTRIIPLYRSGRAVDPDRDDWGVTFGEGQYTFTLSGRSALPQLPGLSELDRRSYYAYTIFPNVMVNMVSTGVNVYTLYPHGPEHTSIVSEFLYRPETIASEGFDCSEMVKLLDLVSRQDWTECERVQQGIRSRGFERALHPGEDRLILEFTERYLAMRGPAPGE